MKFKDEIQKEIYYRGQIDYSYWMLQEILKHNGKMEHPLIAMIDKATGFDKEQFKERLKECKYLVGVIIRCKTKLGYDVTADKKFISELRKLSKQTQEV